MTALRVLVCAARAVPAARFQLPLLRRSQHPLIYDCYTSAVMSPRPAVSCCLLLCQQKRETDHVQ